MRHHRQEATGGVPRGKNMPPKSRPIHPVMPLVAACAALFAAGCSMDDVQFNGGLFNAVGLGDGAKKQREPQVAERAPLVVPPSLDRLPTPGEVPVQPQIAGINDPDVAKKKSRAELEKAQEEYCDKNYRDAGMRGEETAMVEGPLGPCRKSVLTAIKKWNQGDAEEGQ